MENKQLSKELEKLVKPLQEWIFKNYHPHAKVIVDSTMAELVEGQMCVRNKDIENRG